MRVLVTNDDGVESPGIVALTKALHEAGHDVFVVAPASDLSGAGASIGPLHRSEPIPVATRHWPEVPDVPVLAIERPPATAVYLACLGAFGARPDIVASGINPGANTGHLILHSGTVGAALTARGLGVPALAVSIKWSESGYFWETAARIAVPALAWTAGTDAGDRGPRLLNLNVPNRPIDEILGVREAKLAPYGEFWVATSDIRSGDLRIEFQGPADELDPETDAALVVAGYATVTPLLGIVAAPLKGSAESVENALDHEHRDSFALTPRTPVATSERAERSPGTAADHPAEVIHFGGSPPSIQETSRWLSRLGNLPPTSPSRTKPATTSVSPTTRASSPS